MRSQSLPELPYFSSVGVIVTNYTVMVCRHRETMQSTFTTLSSKCEKQMKGMGTDMRNLMVMLIAAI